MSAMSAGLSHLMRSSGLLDSAAETVQPARAAGTETARATRSATEVVADGAKVADARAAGEGSLLHAMDLLVAGMVIRSIWQLMYGGRVPEPTQSIADAER